MVPKLLEQIPPEVDIGPVSANWACDTQATHAVIADGLAP